MPDNAHNESKYAEAKRRVALKTGFYIHALIYVCVISALAGINMLGRGAWWAHWPALGWGIGIAAHALVTFGGRNHRLQAWQSRQIQDELRRM